MAKSQAISKKFQSRILSSVIFTLHFEKKKNNPGGPVHLN